MKRHLPRGRWTTERLADLGWHELAEIGRYYYRRSKKRAQRRIHKIERQQARVELRRAQHGEP